MRLTGTAVGRVSSSLWYPQITTSSIYFYTADGKNKTDTSVYYGTYTYRWGNNGAWSYNWCQCIYYTDLYITTNGTTYTRLAMYRWTTTWEGDRYKDDGSWFYDTGLVRVSFGSQVYDRSSNSFTVNETPNYYGTFNIYKTVNVYLTYNSANVPLYKYDRTYVVTPAKYYYNTIVITPEQYFYTPSIQYTSLYYYYTLL